MYQNKKWFTDVVRTINQIDKLESKQCKHECKCNKDFMTTLKSLYDKVDSDCYDMEMLADFIIDCEEMLNNPNKIKVTFKINNNAMNLNADSFKDITKQIKNITKPEQAMYSIEWNDDSYHYAKSNDIKMIYSILDSLD